ncbi:hypothetical protein NX794_04155 [Streptomyces sp. LP11]|uniref:Uncharacterized protein n=1 Tax=Streptomyces pyxinicus TaxID=2970331 RepID=A0ABT2AW12_9ACTN|nr:hypothetical protein [Streptomyces sp. LP11]MCS0600427.1 hypothetical protein [Streptomyces sp. LP11]
MPYQYQYGAPPPAACQLCGAVPAAPVTVRGHQGMVVVMRFLRRQGMFCRPCALAVFRQMQADTLVQGWWGPLSVVITPFTLLANLGALAAIRRIPAPVAAGHRPPLDPGKPVFRRPQGIIALIPLGLVALVVLAVPVLLVIGLVAGPGDGSPALTVGSCARNDADWPEQDLSPEPCGSAAAQYRVLDPDDDSCPAGAYIAYPEYSATGERSLCLKPLRD